MQNVAYRIEVELESVGQSVLRYGLVLIIVWIGVMKFTAFEAESIRPFIQTSLLMSWLSAPTLSVSLK